MLPFDQPIKQSRNKGIERLLLIAEEIRFRFAHLLALERMAIVGVIGNGDIFRRFAQICRQFLRVESLHLVVNEILKVICVPAFFGQGKHDHGFADENPPLGLGCGHVLVHMKVGVMQSLHFLSNQAPAVLGGYRQEPFPDVIAVTARPKLDSPVSGEFGIAAPESFLHGRTDFAEIVASDRPESHVPASNCNSS